MPEPRKDVYQRLRDQEGAALDQAGVELARESSRPSDFLAATCALLNRRQRYFSMAGEHGSVFDLEGIALVDTLDERLLASLHRVLAARTDTEVPVGAAQRLQGVLTGLPTLPPHPVGYMVIFLLTRALSQFDVGTKGTEPAELSALERALLARIAEWVGGFVHTRQTPVLRHMSDVSREYSVVARLACVCGKTGFAVQRQTLRALPDGGHGDMLSVKCPSCGAEREVEFELPHFGDLGQAVAKQG